MNYFCPKRIRVGRSQRHTSTQTSLECPPWGGGGGCAERWHVLVWLLSKLLQERSLEILMGTSSWVFGIVQKQTGVLWNGEFFFQKKSAILHIHNIMSCKGYMSKNCHENYGKSKLMQKCLRYMYKLSKKMHVFAHTPNTSRKVCIFSPKYQAS